MPTNLVTRSIASLLVLRENAETPSDPEWDDCLRQLKTMGPDFSKVKVLVVTEGGGPTPAQRSRLSAVTGGKTLRSAVVTESVRVRFIVSSVALFMPAIASFGVDEINRAYEHLRLDLQQRVMLERVLKEMSDELTRPPPTIPPPGRLRPVRK
jgi:hypothetical protein